MLITRELWAANSRRSPMNGKLIAIQSDAMCRFELASACFVGALNRWAKRARCFCARITGTWKESSAVMFPWRNKDVQPCLILLLDIGNTHTHLGLAHSKRGFRQTHIRTAAWEDGTARRSLQKFLGRRKPSGAALCSVVPQATPQVKRDRKSVV